MTLLSVSDFAHDFFKSRKADLLRHYPGLKIERILQELSSFSPKFEIDKEDLLKAPHSQFKKQLWDDFFSKVEQGIPLEYISGISFFYRSEFVVSPEVLIPRSETEILVEMASHELKKLAKKTKETLKVAEVGTGSGIIALSLLQECPTPIEMIATDISKEALKVAEINKFRLQYTYSSEHQLNFMKTDRLEGIDGKKHLIVSNPPYIKESDAKTKVHGQVDFHEPSLALYLEDSKYYDWFRDFFKQVYERLEDDGLFLMEGHEDYLVELIDIAHTFDFKEVSILKDYTKRDRFLSIRK